MTEETIRMPHHPDREKHVAASTSRLKIFTCSHMRLVVWRGPAEGWFHVRGHDGAIIGTCGASVHRHEVELPENAHALVNVVNFEDQKGSISR